VLRRYGVVVLVYAGESLFWWHLPERHEMPYVLRRRHLPAQNVKIAVVGANLEKGLLRTIPLA
jgi:hypothetical protein